MTIQKRSAVAAVGASLVVLFAAIFGGEWRTGTPAFLVIAWILCFYLFRFQIDVHDVGQQLIDRFVHRARQAITGRS